MPFEFGRDISVTLELNTISTATTFGTSSARAEADYGHSMTWASVGEVRDAAREPLQGFSVISADSGSDFVHATPVPHPGSAMLMLLELFATPGRLWKSRRLDPRSRSLPSFGTSPPDR